MEYGNFKPGDVVCLKSGGPDMTVASISADQLCRCTWFHGPELKEASFSQDVLETPKRPDKKVMGIAAVRKRIL